MDHNDDKPCKQVLLNEQMIKMHTDRLNKLEELVEKVRNRLPLWATIGFSALMGLLAWFAKG